MGARDDVEIVARYGEERPDDYGGLYFDGEALVVLFTRDLELHELALQRAASRPRRIRVKQASRTWREVHAANRAVTRVLLGDRRQHDVNRVGIGMRDGQFVVVVGVNPYTVERARAIQDAVGGYPVVVEPAGTAHAVGPSAPLSPRTGK